MEPEHSSEFAPQTSLIQLLCSIIRYSRCKNFTHVFNLLSLRQPHPSFFLWVL